MNLVWSKEFINITWNNLKFIDFNGKFSKDEKNINPTDENDKNSRKGSVNINTIDENDKNSRKGSAYIKDQISGENKA